MAVYNHKKWGRYGLVASPKPITLTDPGKARNVIKALYDNYELPADSDDYQIVHDRWWNLCQGMSACCLDADRQLKKILLTALLLMATKSDHQWGVKALKKAAWIKRAKNAQSFLYLVRDKGQYVEYLADTVKTNVFFDN